MFCRSTIVLSFSALALGACASTPGAKPTDMSLAQHEQAAASHEGMATPHQGAYDPDAKQSKEVCSRGASQGVCWSSITNPTSEHKADAETHRKMAADHRAGAEALRTAEAQTCSGLAESDRDNSPFDHREDITGVTPATTMVPAYGKTQTSQVVGATVTFRAVPGLTAEWLQRIVDCHIARNNALGNNVPEMAYCPLVPKSVSARVSSVGSGFAITVESNDKASAQEVLRRAQALRGGSEKVSSVP